MNGYSDIGYVKVELLQGIRYGGYDYAKGDYLWIEPADADDCVKMGAVKVITDRGVKVKQFEYLKKWVEYRTGELPNAIRYLLANYDVISRDNELLESTVSELEYKLSQTQASE